MSFQVSTYTVPATLTSPYAVRFDSTGNMYIADTFSSTWGLIRKLTPSGSISTIAGGGMQVSLDGQSINFYVNGPRGIAVDINNNIYISDTTNHRIQIGRAHV